MGRAKDLSRDIVAYGVVGALSKGVGVLLLPVLTRLFSTEDYGIIDLVASGTNLMALTISLNLSAAVMRFYFDEQSRRYVSSTLTLVLLAGGLFVLGFAAFGELLSESIFGNAGIEWYLMLGLLAGWMDAVGSIPEIVLRMERRVGQFAALSILKTVLHVGLAVALVTRWDFGVEGVFIGAVVGAASKAVVGVVLIRNEIEGGLSRTAVVGALRYALPMLPAVLISWLNKQTDRFILLAFVGLGAVGIFGAASQIALGVGLFIATFRKAWEPFAISLIGEPGQDRVFSTIFGYYVVVGFIVALAVSALGPEIIGLLTGRGYKDGYIVIPWLVGAAVLHGSASITNIGMLISKRTSGNSVAALIGMGLNLAMGLLLIPKYGIIAAAAGTFVGELVFTSLLMYYSFRTASVRFAFVRAAIGVCVFITCAILMLTVTAQLSGAASIGLRLLLFIASSMILLALFYTKQDTARIQRMVTKVHSAFTSRKK